MNRIINAKTTILMRSFIEAYLLDPTQAIADACQTVQTDSWSDNIDEDMIYDENTKQFLTRRASDDEFT